MRLPLRAAALAMAALLVATSAGCGDIIHTLKANYYVKQGNQAYKTQEYLQAIDLYKMGIRNNPNLAIAYYDTALCYMALYKPGSRHPKDQEYLQGAIDYFNKYLRFDPNNEDAKNFLLSVYIQGDRYDDAAAFFEKELRQKGKNPQVASELMMKLGMIHAKKGDFDASMEWYRKRAELDKNNPEAYYTIGVLCWDKVYHQSQTLDNERRAQLIEMGMENLNKAASLRDNYFEAVSYINLLYREKAKLAQIMGNMEDFQKYNDEADKNLKLALELRKKALAKAQ